MQLTPFIGRKGLAFLFTVLSAVVVAVAIVVYGIIWSPYEFSSRYRPTALLLTEVEEKRICENMSFYSNNENVLKDRITDFHKWKLNLYEAKRLGLNKRVAADNHLLIYKSYVLANITSLAFASHQKKDLQELTYHIEKQHSCAIVGNSGILLDSLCGREIDSHDFVVRMSTPPLVKFAEDAGTKVNVTYINRSRLIDLYNLLFGKLKSIEGASRTDMMKRISFLKDSILWYGLELKVQSNSTKQSGIKFRLIIEHLRRVGIPLKFAFSTASIKSDGNRAWKIRTLTTGMKVLFYFVLMCDQVDVYGFFPFHHDSQCRPLKHHYFQTDQSNFNYDKSPHNWKGEFSLLKELHKKGILRLITGKCNKINGIV